MTNGTTGGRSGKETLTFERIFQAAIEDVWTLWTTQEGLESWWGPEGFTTRVQRIDVRAGGELHYAMTATAPEQIGFLERAGMSLTSEQRAVYQKVVPPTELAYVSRADFIPGVAPCDVTTRVELRAEGANVRMLVNHRRHARRALDQDGQSRLAQPARPARAAAGRPHTPRPSF